MDTHGGTHLGMQTSHTDIYQEPYTQTHFATLKTPEDNAHFIGTINMTMDRTILTTPLLAL
jgi:hypothetical protein